MALVSFSENSTSKSNKRTIVVNLVVNFSIIKTSNVTLENYAQVGDLVNFTITVTNLGPSNATNVHIHDILNNEFEYVYSIVDYDNASRMVTWTIDKLDYN